MCSLSLPQTNCSWHEAQENGTNADTDNWGTIVQFPNAYDKRLDLGQLQETKGIKEFIRCHEGGVFFELFVYTLVLLGHLYRIVRDSKGTGDACGAL